MSPRCHHTEPGRVGKGVALLVPPHRARREMALPMSSQCHCTEPSWSSETPRAGYHHFLLSQECRARAGCHHPSGRGDRTVGSVVPGLEPQVPPERAPLALPLPLGVTPGTGGLIRAGMRNTLSQAGEFTAPKSRLECRKGSGRFRAAPVGVWGRSVLSRGWGEALGFICWGNCWVTAARGLSSLSWSYGLIWFCF